ncbi:uncharacterized protein LOC144448190 [Glandiceps talaboti]
MVCGHHINNDDVTNGLNITIQCDSHTFGRYVSIEIIGRTDHLTLCEVQVFADVSEWQVLLKGVSRSGVSVYNMWVNNMAIGCDDDKNINSVENYRSSRVHQWENLSITHVKLSAYKQGREVVTVIFDGTGSTMTNWFNLDRVLESTWPNDLKSTSPNVFSIYGQAGSNFERRFFMSHSDNGCYGDSGWFVVLEKGSPTQCSWEDPSGQVPVFLYSQTLSSSDWDTGIVGEAEVLTISVIANK